MAQIVITLRVRRHTHTVHALIAENCQEHAHAWVCSALTDRVLQCPSRLRNDLYCVEWDVKL